MIKRIIEISQARTRLSIRLGQLIVNSEGNGETLIPCEDIGILLVEHPGTTYTHSVFTELLKYGAAVVLCGQNHHPAGLLLPLEGNTVQTEIFRRQIDAKEPLKKQLWKQIIQERITHQARIVGPDSSIYKDLLTLRKRVRSGDPENIEAQATKKFWSVYLPDLLFHRDTEGRPPNNLLNYGYIVMRAAVARALVSAGLHPSIGIHHRSKYNAFCLADDCLEAFRGFVEAKVREICLTSGVPFDSAQGRPLELSKDIKERLLEVLYQEVTIAGIAGPLMVGLHRTAASLARCFAGEQKQIDLPEMWPPRH